LAIAAAGLCLFLGRPESVLAQPTRDILIEFQATTSSSSPRITLTWPTPVEANAGSYSLYRRVKDGSNWSAFPLASIPSTQTTYADTTAQRGVVYEYALTMQRSINLDADVDLEIAPINGAIAAGYRIPLVTSRGHVLVVVDNTMSTSLAAELLQLERDLAADGWTVHRLDTPRQQIPPYSANPADYAPRLAELENLRTSILNIRAANSPGSRWAVLLIGHVPVPYSGMIGPDGHGEHFGAWPTDSYYVDPGTWTDTHEDGDDEDTDPDIVTWAGREDNNNRVGDGKFDNSVLPSGVVAEIGRVDLYNMPNVSAGLSETELLRQYLVRNHRFRRVIAPYDNVARRILVDDHFGYRGSEAFAGAGLRTGINLFGRLAGQTDELDWFATLQSTPMLMAYGCGGGWYTSAEGIGLSSNFGTLDSKAVFTMLFGSYFGDWDNQDAFLKAPLAGTANSLGLTNVWSGRPWTHLNHMALGETIGYGVRYTQNFTGQGYWYQNAIAGSLAGWVHIGLMGDPTLRLHSMRPPADLAATSVATGVQLTWSASADAADGYHVYRGATRIGPFTKLNPGTPSTANPSGTPLATLSYIDTSAAPGSEYFYLVKAVREETTPSGTYYNQSLGAPVRYFFSNHQAEPAPTLAAGNGTLPGEIALTWSAVAGATTYVVQRGDSLDGAYSTVATVAAPALGHTDTGLIPNTTYFYRLRAQTGTFDTNYSAIVSAQPYMPANYAGWRYRNFLTNANAGNSADEADPDADAFGNLEEYAMGGDPQENWSPVQPLSALVQEVEGQPRLTLTFVHNKAATDLTLVVKVSSAIDGGTADINPLAAENQLQVLDNVPATGLETITVKDTQPVTSADERYMHLEITAGP
jgi:fibronectin type 3 domain-containing protein